tara:strand:+ start:487 stop:1182 length:696 start_codon:yes stop_codon:yes gene_type:complete
MESKIDNQMLCAFGMDHYKYINQLLGDLTLRQIIQEEFKSPEDWILFTEQTGADFNNSFHHLCVKPGSIDPRNLKVKQLKEILKKEGVDTKGLKNKPDYVYKTWLALKDTAAVDSWCSVDEGLQNIHVHPQNTLCQGYSVMKYLGHIKKTDGNPTKYLQNRMAKMWKHIVSNEKISDQIIFSVQQKSDDGGFLMKDVSPRSKGIIKKINKILDAWCDYGWKYFSAKEKFEC